VGGFTSAEAKVSEFVELEYSVGTGAISVMVGSWFMMKAAGVLSTIPSTAESGRILAA